jgi:protease I
MVESKLEGRRVAFLAADGVERATLTEPRRALEAAGARVDLVAPLRGEVWAMDRLERSGTVPVDYPLVDAEPARFGALVLPGGVANVDHLRPDPDAVAFVDAFVSAGTPVGAIGHAPWLLVEADRVRGRMLAAWPSLKTDIENAGGTWTPEQIHLDGALITCRGTEGLESFVEELTEAIAASAPRG